MIGQRLKKLREEKDLTQAQVAKILGVSRTTYTQYETGKSEPDLATVSKLAEIYETSVDFLLGKTDIPTPIETNETRNTTIKRVTQALSSDTELLDFWYELLERDDLQIMFKQVKDMPSDTVRRIIRYIKLVEEEEARE